MSNMKKKALVMLTSLTLALGSILTGCSGTNYDFENNDLTPYVTLPEDFLTRDYTQGLKLEALPTDEDIDKEIKSVMEKNFTEPVALDETATVADGDTVTIDYKGILAGETEAFAGGSATDYKLKINLEKPSFIEGFEAGLIGWTVGKTETLNLKFPDPYPNNADLAGKEVNFEVTLDKIERTTVKELTDTLVADNPEIFDEHNEGIKTVAAYREHLKKEKSESAQKDNNGKIVNAAWKYALDNAKFTGEYPAGLLDKYIKTYTDYYEHTVAAANTETVNGQQVSVPLTLKEYAKEKGYTSIEAFKDAVVKPEAEQALKDNLVLYSCAKAAGVSVSDAEAKELIKAEYEEGKQFYASLGITDPSTLSMYGLSYLESLNSYIEANGGLQKYKGGVIFDRTFEKVTKITPVAAE